VNGWADVVAGHVDLMASALQEHWQQHHGTYHVLGILKLKEIKLPSTTVHSFMNAFFILGVSLLIMCDLVAAKSISIPKCSDHLD
jgi:hypothetical protein